MFSCKSVVVLAAIFAWGTVQQETTVVVVDEVPAVAVRTVYQTSEITVWGCPAWEKNCPVRNGQTQAVVTATVGATTTICPLTFSQARLSRMQATGVDTGGSLSISTTTWPTVYGVPSSFKSVSWDPALWASIFSTRKEFSFGDPPATGTFAPGQFTGTPFPVPTLDPQQAALFGIPGGSANEASSGNSSSGVAGGTFINSSVTLTTGTFAAIVSSNTTAYFTTLNALTSNFTYTAGGATAGAAGTTQAGAAATGVNGSASSLTTLGNGSVITGSRTGNPIALQTVNIGGAIPVSLFSLLVAITALAFAL